jgi:hypothetical protein
MKRGEKVVFAVIAFVVLGFMGRNLWRVESDHEVDQGIPYYSTASATSAREAMDVYRQQNCKGCHSLWTVKDLIESVPAPILDGIGSLRSEEWLYQYFSAANPQTILPSRLKHEYSMPSYAQLPEHERRLLAGYMASLKVKDWYLEQTRKAEYEKLTGKEYHP